MTFFSIFKKKPEPAVVNISGQTGIDLLGDGILFDPNDFLQWGADIESDKLYARKEYRADRTIYHWGERSILNGLKLYFKTICWNHKQHGGIRSFESIDFLAEDIEAESEFERVKTHLAGVFGEPKKEIDVQQGDIALQWKIKAVRISLNLFYKDRSKVHLEIGWWL